MTISLPRRRWRRAAAVAAAMAVTLPLAACGSSDEAAGKGDLTTISFGLPIPAMEAGFAELPVAIEQGFFADEGLEVKAQMLQSGANVLQTLATGRIDIAAPTPDATLAAIGKKQDVRIVYEWNRTPTQYYALKAGSSRTTVDSLKGATIGVSALGSGAKVMSDVALREAGMDPAKDVSYVAVGVGAAALDALQKEKVDALMLWSAQYASMENTGAKLSYVRPDSLQKLFATSLAVSDKWREGHAKEIEGFGRAWARATQFITDNPEEAIRSVWKLYPALRGNDDEATAMKNALNVMDSVHQLNIAGDPGASKTWGLVTKEQAEAWLAIARQSGLVGEDVTAADIYTDEYVEAFNAAS